MELIITITDFVNERSEVRGHSISKRSIPEQWVQLREADLIVLPPKRQGEVVTVCR